jgi:hypothetical protein
VCGEAAFDNEYGRATVGHTIGAGSVGVTGPTRASFATNVGAIDVSDSAGRGDPETDSGRRLAFKRWPGRALSLLRHEWTVAAISSVLLAAVMTWPTLRDPTRTLPKDLQDPPLEAWMMAWSGHAVKTDPTALWHSNTFFPEPYTYAFTDTLFGYFPAGMIGTGQSAAILRYNIVFVFAFALAFFGAYALVRQLGAARSGAAIAGLTFAFAPWRWAQANHLHILSTGGIALALAMLARGHGWSLRRGYRPAATRPGWVVAGWLVAAWQVTLGFGIGLPFAYVLAAIAVVAAAGWVWSSRRDDAGTGEQGSTSRGGLRSWLRRRPLFPRRLLYANLAGMAAFVATMLFMAYPYFAVVANHPQARRGLREIRLYSTPIWGFVTAPAESLTYGAHDSAARAGLFAPAETAVLGGYTLYTLAAVGLFISIWSLRWRLVLVGGVLLTGMLAMGSAGPFRGQIGYVALYRLLPGWDALRTPNRLVLWTTLLMGILAAGAVCGLTTRLRRYATGRAGRQRRAVGLIRLAFLVPALLIVIEGRPALAHPSVPAMPSALRTAQAPMMVLPSDRVYDARTMLGSVDRFPQMVNGYSGFIPRSQDEMRVAAMHFPDAASIALLRHFGVKTVVVLKHEVVGTPYEHAATADVAGLGITRNEEPDAVVYSL